MKVPAMQTLAIKPGALNILCLGAHCDDIEIGCGGSLLKLLDTHPNSHVTWLVFSSNPEREQEARQSASAYLKNAGVRNVIIKQFKESYFPYAGADIKDALQAIAKDVHPDIIFTHYRSDRHQDHRTLSDLTWNAFRNHLILEYEIPKFDGDLGQPNVFIDLTEAQANQKLTLLMTHFASQQQKAWYDRETFLSLLRLRGVESQTRYAEAFHCRKVFIA